MTRKNQPLTYAITSSAKHRGKTSVGKRYCDRESNLMQRIRCLNHLFFKKKYMKIRMKI